MAIRPPIPMPPITTMDNPVPVFETEEKKANSYGGERGQQKQNSIEISSSPVGCQSSYLLPLEMFEKLPS